MDTIRVGFVGCGSHSGTRLYPALRRAGLQLVAVCDLDADRARSRATEYGLSAYYTDHRAMCASEQIDAVLVAVGPQAHYELALDLVGRGYHVWTEKPCAHTAAQADEVARAAAAAGRLVQTGFNYRYTFGIQRARRLIHEGRIGRPAITAVRWWLGVPDLLEFMHHYVVHAVDLIRYLAPGDLTDMDVRHARRGVNDFFVVTFRDGQGGIATLEATSNMTIEGHWSRVDWIADDGMLSVRDFTEVALYRGGAWGRYLPADQAPFDGDRIWRTEPLFTKGDFVEAWGYVGELDRFRRAVRGEIEPECTIGDAAWGLHVCERMTAETASREQV
ncbi:MAG TPA: Gfo/Idh/MocA family oxidoreductase [Chloroflexota bacterium]